jgi:multicomponent Na+:H+ antiporter subunit B
MFNNFFSITGVDFYFGIYLLSITSVLLIISSIRLLFSKSLVETIIIMSVFSLLISLCYLLMDAPDVAMTEVALGSCLSTCVLLNFIRAINSSPSDSYNHVRVILASILCLSFIVILTWVGFDLPEYGAIESSLQSHISSYYIENTKSDIGLPSFVAAILASYRGYDTLGETAVILIAGLSVLLILSKQSSKDA